MTGVSSWFLRSTKGDGTGNKQSSISKDILLALGPPHRQPAVGRFSQLLLEHGESVLQDWAVTVFSSPVQAGTGERRVPHGDKDQKAQGTQLQQASTMPRIMNAFAAHAPTTANADYPRSLSMSRIQGRLHLCSRSLVFEPDDTRRAIVRIPFAHLQSDPSPLEQGSVVQVDTSRHLVMKENNVIGPFTLIKQPGTFKFVFQHSSPAQLIQMMKHLSGKGRTPGSLASSVSSSGRSPEPIFHPENLVDMRESVVLTNVKAWIKTPLSSQFVVLALTADRLYLQPSHEPGTVVANSQELHQHPRPATTWYLRDIVATARRYNGLRDSAIQIYFRSGSSVLIALERRHDREQVLGALPDVTCFTDRAFVEQAFIEWQKGAISNYQYLLALNSAAGRTFHDLGRYPVFPWVVQSMEDSKLDLQNPAIFRDLSKPVGALNTERLEYFRQRMNNMHDMGPEFLYGTHYSAPGYVLYFHVRTMPEHMLCLQNGKFDAADRMFFDISHTFKCALTNQADVKELIPEFYGSDIDFLINAKGLHLGTTQNGQRIDDVQLPPWAKSARDYLKKNRMALESEICTQMLPQWIDLIFGFKSRGQAAAEADNLFHPISYMGPADLATMQSEQERHAAELQAVEFGCCPDQLFVKSHPLKKDASHDLSFISADIGRASSKEDDKGRETWELLDAPTDDSPANELSGILVDNGDRESTESTTVIEQVPNTKLAPYERSAPSSCSHLLNTESMTRSASSENFPVEDPSPDGGAVRDTADWDMHMIERKHIHSDAISGCIISLYPQNPLLVTTGLDGRLIAHKLSGSAQADDDSERKAFPVTFGRFSYSTILSRAHGSGAIPSKLIEYRTHTSRDPFASLALANDGAAGSVAFAGGHDDVVLAYGINSACAVASVYSHRDAVTGLDLISRTPSDLESALWPEGSTHILVSGSWDATVKVWSVVSKSEAVSVNREPLAELFDAESSIVCISAHAVRGGGIVVAAGCSDSSFYAWHIHSDGVQVAIHNEKARRGTGACSVVEWIFVDGKLHLLAAFSTGKVASYSLVGEGLKRNSAVSVGVSILSLAYCVELEALLLGCADGALRLIILHKGTHFDTRPTVWTAVNNKSSPGITSISVTEKSGNGKCLCCTGGADGTIAVFDLKHGSSTK